MVEKVKAYFRKYGMEERVQEFDESSATVELAAKALHCEPQRIAKTLSFMLENSNEVDSEKRNCLCYKKTEREKTKLSGEKTKFKEKKQHTLSH